MIPWENIPVGRNQEIYRMPSVSSIFTVHEYHKKLSTEEQLGRNLVICPSMDPNEAFYVINPMRATNSVFKELEDLMKYLKVFDKNNNYKLLFL
jgi:separase